MQLGRILSWVLEWKVELQELGCRVLKLGVQCHEVCPHACLSFISAIFAQLLCRQAFSTGWERGSLGASAALQAREPWGAVLACLLWISFRHRVQLLRLAWLWNRPTPGSRDRGEPVTWQKGMGKICWAAQSRSDHRPLYPCVVYHVPHQTKY